MTPNGREMTKGVRSQCLKPILPLTNFEIGVQYVIMEMGGDDLEEQRFGHTEATMVELSVMHLWNDDILRKTKFCVGARKYVGT